MPKGSPVERCFQKVKAEGHSEESAARICQSSTGTSLKTGKPPKGKSMRGITYPKIGCSKLRNKCLCTACKKHR